MKRRIPHLLTIVLVTLFSLTSLTGTLNAPTRKCSAKKISLDENYQTLGGSVINDYGSIQLDCTLSPNEYIGTTFTAPAQNGAVLSVGYPADKPLGTQWQGIGAVLSVHANFVTTTNYSVEQQSGSPLIDSNGRVFAITSGLTTTETVAARINCEAIIIITGLTPSSC